MTAVERAVPHDPPMDRIAWMAFDSYRAFVVDVACGVRVFMYSALGRDERSGLVLVLERSSFWVVVIDSWVVWVRPISIR